MGNKILVPLDVSYGSCIEDLGEITDNISLFFKKPSNFKLVLFTGGADITPALYHEESPKGMCMSNFHRDKLETRIFRYALKHGIKMTGICRGSQLINVLSGGRMLHHISNHANTIHHIQIANGKTLEVNSLHHQISIPGEGVLSVGWASPKVSKIYYGDRDKKIEYKGAETEVIIVPSKKGCGVQYHPEIMSKNSNGYMFFHTFIKNFLEMSIHNFIKVYTHKKEPEYACSN